MVQFWLFFIFLIRRFKVCFRFKFFLTQWKSPTEKRFFKTFRQKLWQIFFSDILRASKIVRTIRWDNTSDAKILRTTWHHEIRFLSNLNSTIVIVFSYKLGSQRLEFVLWFQMFEFRSYFLTSSFWPKPFVKFGIRPNSA